jgi:hypothetical protein
MVGTLGHLIDPKLGALAFNGGPTQTFALLSGSPAIDAGSNDFLSDTGPFDQRGPGFARRSPANGIVDIGAFEVQVQGTKGRLLTHT